MLTVTDLPTYLTNDKRGFCSTFTIHLRNVNRWNCHCADEPKLIVVIRWFSIWIGFDFFTLHLIGHTSSLVVVNSVESATDVLSIDEFVFLGIYSLQKYSLFVVHPVGYLLFCFYLLVSQVGGYIFGEYPAATGLKIFANTCT